MFNPGGGKIGEGLRELDECGAEYDDIVKYLSQMGNIASSR